MKKLKFENGLRFSENIDGAVDKEDAGTAPAADEGEAEEGHRVQNNNDLPLTTLILGPKNIVSKGKSLLFCTVWSKRGLSHKSRKNAVVGIRRNRRDRS